VRYSVTLIKTRPLLMMMRCSSTRTGVGKTACLMQGKAACVMQGKTACLMHDAPELARLSALPASVEGGGEQ